MRQAGVLALIAFVVTVGFGVVRAIDTAHEWRNYGADDAEARSASRATLLQWVGIAVGTATAVALLELISRAAYRRSSRGLEALLVLIAIPVLLLGTLGAGLFDRSHGGHLAALEGFWSLMIGFPLLGASELYHRTRRRGEPRGEDAAG